MLTLISGLVRDSTLRNLPLERALSESEFSNVLAHDQGPMSVRASILKVAASSK